MKTKDVGLIYTFFGLGMMMVLIYTFDTERSTSFIVGMVIAAIPLGGGLLLLTQINQQQKEASS